MLWFASHINNNIIKTCIKRTLYNSNSCIGCELFFTDIQSCGLYWTNSNSIKQTSKRMCRKMLSTNKTMLVNNIVE